MYFAGLPMLTNKDYKAMLEAGVDAGLLAIVESAYRYMFEAGGNKVHNELRPLSMEDAARDLNIDISDCTGPEGKVNWNAVSRKLYEDRRFTAVDMKVNAIVRRALDMSGLKHVDEAGHAEYAYPGLEKNTELANIEENLKNGIKQAIVKKYGVIGDIEKFVDVVNGISVDGAAYALAHSYIEPVKEDIVSGHEFNIHRYDVDNDSVDDEYLRGELPNREGRYYENENASVAVINEDGSRWLKEGTSYSLMCEWDEVAVVDCTAANGLVHSIAIYSADGSDGSSPRTLSDTAIVHDFVNMYVHEYGNGGVTGMGLERGFNYRRPVSIMTRVEVCQYLARYISVADAVRLLCLGDNSVDRIWLYGSDPGKTLDLNDFTGLRFFIDCIDAGLLDADDLEEWAEHVDEPDWLMSNVDPKMLMFAKRHDHGLFTRRQVSPSTIVKLFRHLMAVSDDVIPALTGKRPSKSKKPADVNNLPDNFSETDFAMESGMNTNRLKNPAVQVAVLKRTTPLIFLAEMRNAYREAGYIPLSKEAMDYMLMTADSGSRGELAGLIINYYNLILNDSVTMDNLDTRSRKMLFGEIVRNVDERVRSVANTFNDQNQLIYLATHVPGFEMPERYEDYDNIDHTLQNTRRYRGAVSATHLLRVLTRIEYERGDIMAKKRDQLETFMELCLGEPIRKEYEARTAVGKKLRTKFMSFAAEEPHLEDGMKGTPRNMDKLYPFVLGKIGSNFDIRKHELVKFFGTYLNGKDADVSRLYSVKSEQISYSNEMPGLFSGLLNTFDRLFNDDEGIAISAFFGPRGGILSCTTTEFVEVPGATGKKGNRRPVQKDETRVRMAIAAGLVETLLFNDDSFDKKSFMYVVHECLAGRHLIMSPEADNFEMIGKLLYLSGYYDSDGQNDTNDTGNPSNNIVDMADIDAIIMSEPGKLLKYVRSIPRSLARKLCHQYFTQENVKKMSRTREGLKLFLDIADMGDMGDAEWGNFAAAFAAGNANNIMNLIKSLPEEEGERLMMKLKKYLNAANNKRTSAFTAVSGTEVNSQLGSTVQYSMANGLRWMKGYVTTGSPAAMSEDGKAGLYSREDALTMFGGVVDGWRLPTSDEILHLGDNPETISEESLGFSGTGMADADGELLSGSEDFCFAWCLGPDGPVGYSVDSNNVIELNDSNIEPDYKLAIKLVR